MGSAASSIIDEVRRQFREHPGIMTGTERPDYARAVDITARAALRQMVAPGILVVGAPIAVGLIFRYLRDTVHDLQPRRQGRPDCGRVPAPGRLCSS